MEFETLKRKPIELNLAAGKSALSPQTGYIHLNYESDDRYDTIPLLENFCYVLALLRSRIAENVLEAKAFLEKLLIFEVEGNFPIYLHEFPQCKDRAFSLELLPIFHWMVIDFRLSLGDALATHLDRLIARIISHGYKMHAQRPLSSAAEFRLKSYFEPASVPSWVPKTAEEWADLLITQQMTGKTLASALQEWHPQLCVFLGSQTHVRAEPKVTLFDVFMGHYHGVYSRRALEDKRTALLASLIQPFAETFSLIARESICESPYTVYWGSPAQLHSLTLDSKAVFNRPISKLALLGKIDNFCADSPQNFESMCKYMVEKFCDEDAKKINFSKQSEFRKRSNRDTNDFSVLLPPRVFQEGEDALEVSCYVNVHPQHRLQINGTPATTFQLGDVVEVICEDRSFRLKFTLVEGEGQFFGHLLRANRPNQRAKQLKFETFDWQIALRTIRRSEQCLLKLELIL